MDWVMLNLVQLRQLLRELIIVRGFKAEIYERINDEWEAIYGSPGNLSCVGTDLNHVNVQKDPKIDNFLSEGFT